MDRSVRIWIREKAEDAARFCTALALAIVLVFGVSAGAAGIYLTKRALHIDLVPGVDMVDDRAVAQILE